MEKEKINTGVNFFQNTNEKNKDWLKGRATITIDAFRDFLKAHPELIKTGKYGKYVSFDLKYSKDKRVLWLDLNTYIPEENITEEEAEEITIEAEKPIEKTTAKQKEIEDIDF